MRTLILDIIFLLLISFISYGQKYYTLTSGNWNNTTTVWSLNGSTPCGCYPGNSLVTDTIVVNHPLSLTAHLNASTLSKIQINSGGSLSNSLFDIYIANSVVLANGSINVKKLTVAAGAAFTISNSTLMINAAIDIYGSFQATFSNIYVLAGNIEVFSTGSFVIGNGSRINFTNGNFRNEGLTSICSVCCLSFDKGNVTNEISGTFTGGGSVTTSLGNIKNFGTWDPLIRWCSNGSDVGMVSPENCILANDMCLYVPLPTELVYFDGFTQNEYNTLIWETASENNTDYYLIESSKDGLNWNFLEEVDAAGTNQVLNKYNFVDQNKNSGLIYYKLSQIDLNGTTKLSQTLSLINDSEAQLILYPNPTNDQVTIQLQKNNPYTQLKIVDALGRQLNQLEIGDTFTLEIQLPVNAGIYFIQAEGEDITDTYTLIKN
jgi:hypothetical protein